MARFRIAVLVCSVLLAANTKIFVKGKATIDPSLQQRFFSGQNQNVMVSFTQGIQPVIDQINSMNFSSSGEKRSALTSAQQAFASTTQAPLQSFLGSAGVPFESFWINNMMSIKNVDSGLIQMISSVPGVANIGKEPQYRIEPPIASNGSQSRATTASWGVKKIRADQVWGNYTGKGVVVANIDTGVKYTHEALTGRWRSNYGWYDPYKGTSTPNDQNGHGTHTMGTIAGGKGIGVAPDATWIACKGCSQSSCGGNELYKCGQWIQCPFKSDGTKDCEMAPDVVSNSWGGGNGDSGYDRVIQSWRTAGIIPVFSIGNAGSDGCKSANSPGDNKQVIGVGSTDESEQISYFSSLGPSVNGNRKPDISAPGGKIYSSWYSSNTAYNTISGTSMACPHVSGVVALMVQKKRSLTYDEAYKAITKTAITKSLDAGDTDDCGGIDVSTFPNNVFGYGRIDAVNAVNSVK